MNLLHLDEIKIGQPFVPIKKEITQEKINKYISAAEDFNPIHTDPEYAKNTAFKSTIAPGYQFIAYLSELMARDFGEKWITGGKMDLKLLRPVFPGDSLSVEGKITDKASGISGTTICCELWVINQKGQEIVKGTTSVTY